MIPRTYGEHNYATRLREMYFQCLPTWEAQIGEDWVTTERGSLLFQVLEQLNLLHVLSWSFDQEYYIRFTGSGYDFMINVDPVKYLREQRTKKLTRILV